MKSGTFQKSRLATVASDVIMAGLLIYFLYPVVLFLIPPKECCQDQDLIQIEAAEVPEGTYKIISGQKKPIIVIHTHGEFFALSAVTQRGCPLQWDESNQEIVCFCRGSRFDLYGNVKSGPARDPLTTLKTGIVNAKVIIGGNSLGREHL